MKYRWNIDNDIANLKEKKRQLEFHCIRVLMCHIYYFSYKVGSIPSLLYIASGGSLDWALGEAEIPYSFGNISSKDLSSDKGFQLY